MGTCARERRRIVSRTLENRVRRKAGRIGFRVCKSRQQEHYNNQGEYLLADDRNHIVLGDRYDARLADIEAFLDKQNAEVPF
jgi:hypothetical protein